MLETAN